MLIDWTKHLRTEDEIQSFKKQVHGSKPVLDHLLELLNQKEKALDRSELDIKTFDTPNWENKQAYKNGSRACLEYVKTLVDLDRQKSVIDQVKET